MTAANDPGAWQNFYLMIGTANAAITGLLFVALSLHLREILKHPTFRPRAVIVLVILTTQIVISAVVLTPQSRMLMGWEILGLNFLFLAINLQNRAPVQLNSASAFTLLIRLVYVYAAVSLILGLGGGFYVLGASLLVTLGRSMANCWSLLTAVESDIAA